MQVRTGWQSHPVFDIESRIIETGNHPSPVDLSSFQRRLDAIAGQAVTGQSLIRIEWGQDAIGARMIVCGSWRLKHCFYRGSRRHELYNPVSGLFETYDEMFEIGIPRFFITELHSRSELSQGNGWEKARWLWEDGQLIDVLGPLPDSGFYSTIYTIAHHDHLCCGGRGQRKGEPCLGSYREPDESDLERVARMKWRRDHASNDDFAPSLGLLAKRGEEFRGKRDERWQARVDGAIDDYVDTRKHSWATHDPAALSWGKYHFTQAHNLSGLSPLLKEKSHGSSDGALLADSTVSDSE